MIDNLIVSMGPSIGGGWCVNRYNIEQASAQTNTTLGCRHRYSVLWVMSYENRRKSVSRGLNKAEFGIFSCHFIY